MSVKDSPFSVVLEVDAIKPKYVADETFCYRLESLSPVMFEMRGWRVDVALDYPTKVIRKVSCPLTVH